jgi:hypothetical protein
LPHPIAGTVETRFATTAVCLQSQGPERFSVEFKKDASGKSSEMLVVQPEGPAVAKKKPWQTSRRSHHLFIRSN